jgi:hypothetical protein
VRDEEDGAPAEERPAEAALDDVLRRVHVEGREDVVEQHDLRARVHRARERDPRLLPAREGEALLADLGAVARVEEREVACEPTLRDDLLVPGLVVRRAKQNVVLRPPSAQCSEPATRYVPGSFRSAPSFPAQRTRRRPHGAG